MEYKVCKEGELKAGECRSFSLARKQVLVFCHIDGSFSALADCCSHAQVALSKGIFADGAIECPAHGARFDARTGKNLCLPAVKPVEALEIKVENGDIVVTVHE